jgi:hypothetical protein
MDELLKLAAVFLTSNTILINALGVARTEPLKTGISAVGLAMTILWLLCALNGPKVTDTRAKIFNVLPFVFLLGWLISGIVHGRVWCLGLPAT